MRRLAPSVICRVALCAGVQALGMDVGAILGEVERVHEIDMLGR